jgi:GNAT superfamily N-acetyltransferase
MRVKYRLASADEAEMIKDFQIAMALETEALVLEPSIVLKGVQTVFKHPDRGTYHICECDEKIVGCLLIINEWSDWRNAFVWWIHSLYILPAFRGKKIFSGFFNYIQKLVDSNDEVRGLRLYVDKRNIHAKRVYEKMKMRSDHYELFERMK